MVFGNGGINTCIFENIKVLVSAPGILWSILWWTIMTIYVISFYCTVCLVCILVSNGCTQIIYFEINFVFIVNQYNKSILPPLGECMGPCRASLHMLRLLSLSQLAFWRILSQTSLGICLTLLPEFPYTWVHLHPPSTNQTGSHCQYLCSPHPAPSL